MKHVFLKNEYPLTFIDKCFKMAINNLVIKIPQVTIVEKILILSLPYLEDVSSQTRTKSRNSFKSILTCFKLQVIFKRLKNSLFSVWKMDYLFWLSVWCVLQRCLWKVQISYYSEKDRQLKFRSGDYIPISTLTFTKIKPSKESAIRDHVLNCNNIPSFNEFTILAYGHHKYILEI